MQPCMISLIGPRHVGMFAIMHDLPHWSQEECFVCATIDLPRHAACAAILCYPESIFQYCPTVLLIDNNNYVHLRTTLKL